MYLHSYLLQKVKLSLDMDGAHEQLFCQLGNSKISSFPTPKQLFRFFW
jgi:hypothetical protein